MPTVTFCNELNDNKIGYPSYVPRATHRFTFDFYLPPLPGYYYLFQEDAYKPKNNGYYTVKYYGLDFLCLLLYLRLTPSFIIIIIIVIIIIIIMFFLSQKKFLVSSSRKQGRTTSLRFREPFSMFLQFLTMPFSVSPQS